MMVRYDIVYVEARRQSPGQKKIVVNVIRRRFFSKCAKVVHDLYLFNP